MPLWSLYSGGGGQTVGKTSKCYEDQMSYEEIQSSNVGLGISDDKFAFRNQSEMDLRYPNGGVQMTETQKLEQKI